MSKIDKQQIKELKDVVTILQEIDSQLFFEEIATITEKANKIETVSNRETLQARNWHKFLRGAAVFCETRDLAKEFIGFCVKTGIRTGRGNYKLKEDAFEGYSLGKWDILLYTNTLEEEGSGLAVMKFKGLDEMFANPEKQLPDVYKAISDMKADSDWSHDHSDRVLNFYAVADELRARVKG